MHRMRLFLACGCLIAACCNPWAAEAGGLIAEWNFDEGKGDVARDSSGNGHDAKLFGASWVRQGDGFALSLDGVDDYVECGTLPIEGPIGIELWIEPLRKGHGLAVILGEDLHSYLLTYYNTEVCDLYIGGGGNNARGSLNLNAWNHVVAGFDGERITMWVNGRQTSSVESRFKNFKASGLMVMGTKRQPALPRFKGLLDRVRIYSRALSNDEAVAHFRAEAAQYGYDPAWFTRVRTTLYEYLDADDPRVVVEANYIELLPLQGAGRLEATLSTRGQPEAILRQETIAPAPARDKYGGVATVRFPCRDLATGGYLVRVTLRDERGAYPTEELTFSWPPPARTLPAPRERVAAPLPPTPASAPFEFRMRKGGGFEVMLNGVRYPFVTRISWPNGDFNRFTAADQSWRQGEKAWRVVLQEAGETRWIVESAGSAFYKVRREAEVFPTHVQIKDTYTNLTDLDLGLLIYNETPLKPGQVTGSWLSGYERWGRQAEMTYPDYGPSAFFTDAANGMGVIPVDDVFVVQGLPYVAWQDAAGVCTEKFALAPGASYTLEWAVYPTGSKDYYDFVNAFRRAEDRISTIPGAPGYLTATLRPPWRREVPDADYVAKRNLKIGLIHNLAYAADDPNLHIEGIEFTDFPKEMALMKEMRATIRQKHPGLKAIFHIAHSLYCTNRPDRFSDSKVITEAGKQATWGDGSAFGETRKAEGWQWWIFYPTPGNTFHDAMMKSVDVMMDDMGFDGGFLDGFLAGYAGHWSYDADVRWDGHSAQINVNTRTIERKMNSVILLSQPSMIEYARKIHAKGGVVIAHPAVLTRSITAEKHLIFATECASGPELHLAPNGTVLGMNQGFRSERHIYLDILDKLRWGELYLHYLDGRPLTHESLAARQYPITCEEIRPGLVRGPERIVTMNPGVYGWPGRRDLHLVHRFDARGAPASHAFVTTVVGEDVRTELALQSYESAVVEPVPATIESDGPVNVCVTRYDSGGMRLILNGVGAVTLRVRSGAFPVTDAACPVTLGTAASRVVPRDRVLTVPLQLDGLLEVRIEPSTEKP